MSGRSVLAARRTLRPLFDSHHPRQRRAAGTVRPHRHNAAVGRRPIGVDLDVIAPCTRGVMASSATRAMNVSRPNLAHQRGGAGDARGTRGVECVRQALQGVVDPLPGHSDRRATKAVV